MEREVPKLILPKLLSHSGLMCFWCRIVCLCNIVSIDWFRIETPFNLDKDKNKTWVRAVFFWTQFRDYVRQ